MIDFIIVEDNISFITTYKHIIDKVMMNYDIDYTITIYDKYNRDINQLLTKDSFKIYIISYSKKKNSMEMILYIRETLDDWQSLIIIMNENKEEIKKEIDRNFFLLDIISKIKDYREPLKRAIQISLKYYDQRPNTLKYNYKKVFYNIDYWKILYIEKESDLKLCKIKTIENTYYIQMSIARLEQILDKRFLKCNRSYIINLEQIETYNTKTNTITFKNKEIFDAISREKRKDIIHYLRRIEK